MVNREAVLLVYTSITAPLSPLFSPISCDIYPGKDSYITGRIQGEGEVEGNCDREAAL